MSNKIIVFDNGGKTADRYTLILPDGDVYGCSENPYHPQGIGTFNCNVCEARYKDYQVHYDHDKGVWFPHALKWAYDDFLKEAHKNDKWLGEEVTDQTKLPEAVQKYIAQLDKEMNTPRDPSAEPEVRSITISSNDLPALKKAYEYAVKMEMPEFTFRGALLLPSYAKYLIEYLESVPQYEGSGRD